MKKYTFTRKRISHKGLLSRDILSANHDFESIVADSERMPGDDSVQHLKTSSPKTKRRDISTYML